MSPGEEWITRGFEGFSEGSFGNSGQNLYVSRGGILQRIHHFDLDDDGHVDLLLCNSQEHSESPPSYVYGQVFGETTVCEVPAEGAVAATLADVNGDGYDDLVLGRVYDGIRHDLNAIIFYGSPQGLSEARQQRLPAPRASSVAAGDLNGDGRLDLAFAQAGELRVFYQTELGFEPKRYVQMPVSSNQVTATDIDRDGFADLFVLGDDGAATILWGSPDGLRPDDRTEVPTAVDGEVEDNVEISEMEAQSTIATGAQANVVNVGGVPHLALPLENQFMLLPVLQDRSFGEPVMLTVANALAAAGGDFNGDGHLDLAIAARSEYDGEICSWVYFGAEDGFSEERRAGLPGADAVDVAVGDLDDDGYDDIVICRGRTPDSFTNQSLVFRGGPEGISAEPLRLITHEARNVVIGRTSDDPLPQVVFANRAARGATGDVDPCIYYGGANGFDPQRRAALSGRDAVAAAACDLDDSGLPDLIIANCAENAIDLDPGSFIFHGREDGYRYEPDVALNTTRAHGVVCADFNRDGYLDLVLGGFRFPELQFFYGGPNGFDAESPEAIRMEIDGVEYDQPRWLYTADLDNDGWLDIVIPQIAYDRSIVLYGSEDGFSLENRQMLSVFHGSYAQAADLTGNGYLDLIVGGHAPSRGEPQDSFVYVYWNSPDGLREDNRMLLPAQGVNALAVADIDGDGRLDLVVSNYHSGKARDIDSYIYWGQEDGRFSATDFERIPAHSASGLVVADFDLDGHVDLFVVNHKVWRDHVGESCVWWNGPSGFSPERTTSLPSMGPHGTYVVDAGNQADRGHEEYYTSRTFRLPAGVEVRGVDWDAEIPEHCWVAAQLRFAESEEALTAAPWQGGDGDWLSAGEAVPGGGQGPWVQYRLALGALWGCRTPRVRSVSVRYG